MATVNDTPQVTMAGGPAEQYSALRQVAMAVARGSDSDAVFALVAERTARLVGADGSGVIRFDRAGRGRLVGHWIRPGLVDGDVPQDIDLSGTTSVAIVSRTGAPARVDDYTGMEDPRGRFLARAYTSGVAVPIRLASGVWGAVAVGARHPNVLGPETEGILTEFAELVALTVAGTDPNLRAGSATLLDTLLDSAPVGIAFLDPDLRFARVNPAFATVAGLDVDAHSGLRPGDDPSRFPHVDVQAAARVRTTGVPQSSTLAARSDSDADGRRWLTGYYPITDRDGICGVGVVVTDITEHHRDAEALRRERDYSATLIGAMNDGLIVWTSDGTITDVSARLCELTGYARDELVGIGPPYPFWGAGDDAIRASEAFDRVMRGACGDCDLDFARRDGRSLPVHCTHAPIVDPDGRVRRYIATIRDITDRRRAEQERAQLFAAERAARNRTEILQQVSAALSKALTPEHVVETTISDALPLVGAVGGSVILDIDGVLAPVVRPDRRMRLLTAPQEFVVSETSVVTGVVRGDAPVFLSDPAAIAAADPEFAGAVRADVEAAAIVPIGQPGLVLGALALGFPGERVFDTEDRALLVTIGDLCAQALERARLYDAARARADAFRERDALRQAVLRGVSHEFRSPLTAISNAADALARIADDDLRGELLDVIGTETRRLDRFVANVLDLSRLEGGVLEPNLDSCSPTELVAGALEAVDALVGDIGITVDIPPDIPLVLADPVLTERILLNLVHNASRHGGSRIELRVRHVEGRVWFIVIDDGPGVPRGMRRTIFEPFVGQRERGGLGLGLGLSKGLAVAQGGDLWLDDGRGDTRFVVALPVDRRPVDRRITQ